MVEPGFHSDVTDKKADVLNHDANIFYFIHELINQIPYVLKR